ncbi:hypothetical protein QZH41_001889 [Actinostola sp. cb2023]|nr:hypothetical protein QZH41_001889 [Actinostola sp. cb2023]
MVSNVRELDGDLMALTAKVESLQKQLATNNVEHALDFVRQLANRPVPLLDNHALEQLEQLADTARETGHKERKNALRNELKHWHFLDTWKECLPWPRERHLVVNIFSDASDFAWGGIIKTLDESPFSVHDYWTDSCRYYPIVVKEARALVMTLQAGKSLIANSRLDVHTDNMVFMQFWLKQGGDNSQLNDALKELSATLLEYNVTASFQFIHSSCNPANFPSRTLSDKDCMLSKSAWMKVNSRFGPHTLDLMSLDSNAQKEASGNPLRYFTPHPTPLSSGVNVFAQEFPLENNAYVFPHFVIVGPLLKFLAASNSTFTIVAPKLYPLPFRWPLLCSRASSWIQMGSKGDFIRTYLFRAPYNGTCLPLGFRREVVTTQPVDPSSIDLESRLSEQAKNKASKPYERQKSALHRELLSVLAALPTPKTLQSATPGDILKFLVWKDNTGRTKQRTASHKEIHDKRKITSELEPVGFQNCQEISMEIPYMESKYPAV